jgi:hypothetical protein
MQWFWGALMDNISKKAVLKNIMLDKYIVHQLSMS